MAKLRDKAKKRKQKPIDPSAFMSHGKFRMQILDKIAKAAGTRAIGKMFYKKHLQSK